LLNTRSLLAIDYAVAQALPAITEGDAIGWFEHFGIQVRQTIRQLHYEAAVQSSGASKQSAR